MAKISFSLHLKMQKKSQILVNQDDGKRAKFQTKRLAAPRRHWARTTDRKVASKERTWARSLKESPSGLVRAIILRASGFHHFMLDQYA